MSELNDELLVAYVDGQLADNQSKAIERVLEADQVAARRVEDMRAASAQLEAAFEAMLADEQFAPAAAGTAAFADIRPAWRGLTQRLRTAGLVIGVGIGCLLGGAAAGFFLHDQIAATWLMTPDAVIPDGTLPAGDAERAGAAETVEQTAPVQPPAK